MDELNAWLTLMRAPGLHAGSLRQLLEQHSSVSALVHVDDCLATGRIIICERAPALARPAVASFHSRGSPKYPALLADLPDAPLGLFVRGDPECSSLPQLAIVGSRNPTTAGRDTAEQFAAHLARSG